MNFGVGIAPDVHVPPTQNAPQGHKIDRLMPLRGVNGYVDRYFGAVPPPKFFVPCRDFVAILFSFLKSIGSITAHLAIFFQMACGYLFYPY